MRIHFCSAALYRYRPAEYDITVTRCPFTNLSSDAFVIGHPLIAHDYRHITREALDGHCLAAENELKSSIRDLKKERNAEVGWRNDIIKSSNCDVDPESSRMILPSIFL